MNESFVPADQEQPELASLLPAPITPREYESDPGIALAFNTFCGRGHDPSVVKQALDAYEGDLWWDFFGPALDNVAAAIGLPEFPEEGEGDGN